MNVLDLPVTWEKRRSCTVISHLEELKLFPDFQSAYRRGHSTETAVSDLIDAISNGKFDLLSLLDLTAAFDMVDHNILLHRLQTTFGFHGIPFQWMRSYLDGWTRSVLLGGNSIASLFIGQHWHGHWAIWSQSSEHSHDNQLYSFCNKHDCVALKSRMIKCIESNGEWMSINQLLLNPSKSEFMWFASQCWTHFIDTSAFVLLNGLVNVSS